MTLPDKKNAVAIIGSGNIGADLMIKVLRNSSHLRMGALVGINPNSEGLARATRMGVPSTADGVKGLQKVDDIADRFKAFKNVLKPETGMHANHMGVANSLVALGHGCDRIDASLTGMGAGAGNARLEVFIAAVDHMGPNHGCAMKKLIDAAEDSVRPMQECLVHVDHETLALGYAGVYSSFLRHTEAASQKDGIPAFDIPIELGRRMVGGQEDMVVDVALGMLKARAIGVASTTGTTA